MLWVSFYHQEASGDGGEVKSLKPQAARASPYRSGRSKTWLKTKCFKEGEFILLGIDRDRKSGAPRALLAQTGERGLAYAGAAFLALPGDAREALAARLDQLAQDRPAIMGLGSRHTRWIRPEIVVKVKHLAGARLLRHATVRELSEA